jgi:hypothetical protein
MPANVQPIYPKDIIRWKTTLTNQVVPRSITTQTPILLGTAGENGAIIHAIDVRHLGDNVQSVARLWIKFAGDTAYYLENELSLAAISGSTNDVAIAPIPFTLPAILPNGNTGLHLEPGESLYAGLGTAIANGVVVSVRGGDY